MLDAKELDRRLKALRELRGYTQKQLETRLGKAGLKKTDLGKLERGEKPLTDAMLAQLMKILRAPEAYFTEEDLDEVLFRQPAGGAPQALGGRLGRDLRDADPSHQDHERKEPPEAAGGSGGTG